MKYFMVTGQEAILAIPIVEEKEEETEGPGVPGINTHGGRDIRIPLICLIQRKQILLVLMENQAIVAFVTQFIIGQINALMLDMLEETPRKI